MSYISRLRHQLVAKPERYQWRTAIRHTRTLGRIREQLCIAAMGDV